LIPTDLNSPDAHTNFVWNKEFPFKASLFTWHLLHNRIPTTNNLIRMQVLQPNVHLCVGGCGKSKDIDNLFLSCDFFKKIWYGISSWLGFIMVHLAHVLNHLLQFEILGGFPKKISAYLFI
jgi:hypothetical protein